jgi:hypothetical protein
MLYPGLFHRLSAKSLILHFFFAANLLPQAKNHWYSPKENFRREVFGAALST